jgi:inorganic phosphate transporter, PiT family
LDLGLLIAVILVALCYDFMNGMHDCANAIATVVSTRALSPRQALALARTLNIVGAFLSTAVARTIGKDIVDPHQVGMGIVLAACLGAIFWDLITWWLGLPTSSTHALVGGLIGAVTVHHGFGVLQAKGLTKVAIGMVVSPCLGFLAGFVIITITKWICHWLRLTPAHGDKAFRPLQILSSSYMALSHGTNDTQTAMGMITMALVAFGKLETFHVPFWVILCCGLAMGLGTQVGGWRIIKTMGMRIASLRTIHGFSAETAAATVILGSAAGFGFPVSTTHAISASIVGVGASQSLSMVRWGVAYRMVGAWVLTVPGAGLIGAAVALVFRRFGL